MFRFHVVSAICMRNLKQYFSGVLGYVFIFVFVVVSAIMAFNQQFFADNQTNLDQLTRFFPLLLLFIAPAIAMTVWSDEKRQGTDAILFTLPATDFEILLGKYLAVASVYTIALLFSLTQLVALAILGNPDWGVIATTYLGYWLAGLALIS
ncbi:MAG TPA: ABC-2 transporter permease, partial [Pirellulaceae bacterium]|nr:ABC-2 transporter permease [Pirellulaceae bacterium]